ncbi:MAG: Rubrerythrin [Methanomicrobiales archaeon]|nr:Rubrerythrin [Methanomicrobiales archaeon]
MDRRGETIPEFVNPFSGKIPDRKLTRDELVRALRLDLAAEHEAVHAYTAHAEATDDPLARAVLLDIAGEERVHAGEFARLIAILTKDEDQFLAKGAAEVDAVVKQLSGGAPPAAAQEKTTLGSLREGGG